MGAMINLEKARVVKLEMPIPGHPDVSKAVSKVDYNLEVATINNPSWKTFAVYTDPVLANFVKNQIDLGVINP